jgi:hypothetical protein
VARLEVQPAEDRALPHRVISQLDEEATDRSVLVVPVQDVIAGTLPQGVPDVEGAINKAKYKMAARQKPDGWLQVAPRGTPQGSIS